MMPFTANSTKTNWGTNGCKHYFYDWRSFNDKTAWATYRQALRDFPATWKPAETANFPETPA
jgi:hypothetical protein